MPATWKTYSKDNIGYVAPLNEDNAEYVTIVWVQKMLNKGKSDKQIVLMWNAGERATKCSKGINKHGVKFDSCKYVAMYKKMK